VLLVVGLPEFEDEQPPAKIPTTATTNRAAT